MDISTYSKPMVARGCVIIHANVPTVKNLDSEYGGGCNNVKLNCSYLMNPNWSIELWLDFTYVVFQYLTDQLPVYFRALGHSCKGKDPFFFTVMSNLSQEIHRCVGRMLLALMQAMIKKPHRFHLISRSKWILLSFLIEVTFTQSAGVETIQK